MKYNIWTAVGIGMLVGGSYWLFNLITASTPFLVLPEVFRYQGALLLVFSGGMAISLAVSASKKNRVIVSLTKQYPLQPWMWRSDWARSRSHITSSTLIGMTIFAALWMLVPVPVLVAALPKYSHEIIFKIIFAYGFPAIGILMLVMQIVKWFKYKSAKNTVLKFKQLPARIGERFECELTLPRVKGGLQYKTELVCMKEYTETVKTPKGYSSRFVRDEIWRNLVVPNKINTS